MTDDSSASQWPPHIAARFQEDTTQLRFMKRQQWAITNYLLALLAGIFGIVKAIGGLAGWEKDFLLTIIPIAAFGAVILLTIIERDMAKPRERLAMTNDYWPTSERVTFRLDAPPTTWVDDLLFLIPLGLVCLVSAAIVWQAVNISGPRPICVCWT